MAQHLHLFLGMNILEMMSLKTGDRVISTDGRKIFQLVSAHATVEVCDGPVGTFRRVTRLGKLTGPSVFLGPSSVVFHSRGV